MQRVGVGQHPERQQRTASRPARTDSGSSLRGARIPARARIRRASVACLRAQQVEPGAPPRSSGRRASAVCRPRRGSTPPPGAAFPCAGRCPAAGARNCSCRATPATREQRDQHREPGQRPIRSSRAAAPRAASRRAENLLSLVLFIRRTSPSWSSRRTPVPSIATAIPISISPRTSLNSTAI